LYIFILAVVLLWLRSVVQRFAIRRAGMVVCISSVFRDDLVRDYGLAREVCEVVPNPVRLARFTEVKKEPGRTPVLLVLGRIAVRKGIDDVVAVAGLLHDRNVDVRIRVVGGPTLYSDYRKLLEDLPDNAEYAGRVPPTQVAAELAQSDVLLQPSTYEPFGLTVGEALAAGVPVVASTVVGAIEGVDRRVAAAVEPGDAHGIAAAVEAMLEELRRSPQEVESTARGEAARLFAPETVCRQISDALAQLAPPAE
jgi:glycosyltransferase involved in cell wall biosynthesis